MQAVRRILIIFCCFCLLLSLAGPAAASDTDDILRQLLQYYLHHQDNAETDILRLLAQLETIDPEQAEDWRGILSAWHSACNDLVIHSGILPDGLPEDDSLCIVVMGFALNYNGSMSEELEGRISTALASAEKYPNSYILCTGGGTARGNYAVTEAGQMAAWLIEQGIAEERIILENRSYSTELNVRYSLEILQESHPQIKSLAVVTSDYHIRRCHWLFEAEIILQGLETQYQVISNAAYRAGYPGESGYWFEAQSLSNLLNLNLRYSLAPKLSKLNEISAQVDETCEFGEMPDLTVTAYYDSGFSRDVTHKAEIRNLDPTIPGETQAEILYAENGIIRSVNVAVTVLDLPTEAPTEPPVTIQTEPTATEHSVLITELNDPERTNLGFLWIILAPALAIVIFVPKKHRGKYQK